MPSSLPPAQTGPNAWRADQLSATDWTWTLTDQQVGQLVRAAERHRQTVPAEFAALDTAALELDAVAPLAADLHRELIAGRGFALLRGLPTSELDEDVSAAAFLLLGRLLGSARRQNAAGDLLGHVRNVGADPTDPHTRIYQTNARQTFHTDSTDVVGLLCLQDAKEGGESMLVSATAIYNRMRDVCPDLAAELFTPVATDRRGEVPPGAEPYFVLPVLSWYDDALTVIYQRQYIDSAARHTTAPPLTDTMVAALDRFDDIANDPTMHLRMRLEIGDMQFVHNHSLLHDRTGFEDHPGRPRHLLRLWLSVPGDRELPPEFAQRYGTTTVGDGGGITT